MTALTISIQIYRCPFNLESAMSTLAAVFAVLISAAAAGLTTLRIVEARELRARAAAQAEELYALVESFDQSFSAYFTRCRSIIAEGRAFAPLEEAGWREMRRDSARARTLVGLYFPALWPQVRRTDALLSQAVATLRRYEDHGHNDGLVRSLDRSLEELKDAMEALKGAVVVAHRVGDSRRPVPPRRKRPGLRLAV
jgi:hypothetical protein